jgi:hypothetical protein
MAELSKEIIESSMSEVSELSKKEFELRKATVTFRHETLKKQIQELDGFKTFKLGVDQNRVDSLKKENKEYITLAKTASVFLANEQFRGNVPMFARNLIFVGAQSGEGKSTLTANIAWQFIRQNKRVLIITNEEHPTDVLNRIACLNKGWAYYDHTQITEEQQAEFDRLYPVLLQRIEIIDDQYNGVGGLTTTIEGVTTITESLKVSDVKYDVILIDYFQNINSSHKNPSASGYEVLHDVGRLFDRFKTVYNAPIVMLGTLKAAKEDDSTPFKERIEGRKSIFNFSTCCIEVRADKANSRSEWIFHKSRFARAMGLKLVTGFDKGRYVEYNSDFARSIEQENNKKMMQSIGVQDGQKLKAALALVNNVKVIDAPKQP